MEEILKGTYSEPRHVRADGSVIWSIWLLEKSGLVSGNSVIAKTIPSSGKIEIERREKVGGDA